MLTGKQKQIAKEIFSGRLTDSEICDQYHITAGQLARWRSSDEFLTHIDSLCEQSARDVRCILARYGPLAAMRLTELLAQTEKPDVVRRASLDLIDRCMKLPDQNAPDTDDTNSHTDLTDDQARQLLLTLAEGVKDQSK